MDTSQKNNSQTVNSIKPAKKRLDRASSANIVGILINTLIALIKFVLAYFTASYAVMVDGFNNLGDSLANVANICAFKLAEKPADEKHPYGHGRYEYIAGLFVSISMLILGMQLFIEGIKKILSPAALDFSVASIVILAVTIVLKFLLGLFYNYKNKKINSPALKALALDSFSDALVTLGVLAVALIYHFFALNLDSIISVIIALIVFKSGFEILTETISPIIGENQPGEVLMQIKQKLLSYPEVSGIHELYVHDYGETVRFASVHIVLSSELDLTAVHDLVMKIEADFLRDENIRLTIHADPAEAELSE